MLMSANPGLHTCEISRCPSGSLLKGALLFIETYGGLGSLMRLLVGYFADATYLHNFSNIKGATMKYAKIMQL